MTKKTRKKRNDLPVDNETICEALRKANGYLIDAAKILNKSRTWLYYKCTEDPELKKFMENLTEERLDKYEAALDDLRDDKNTTAIIFFLKTKGRSRGYVEHAPKEEVNLEQMKAMTDMFLAISKSQSLLPQSIDSAPKDPDLLPEKTDPVEIKTQEFQSEF